jgi:mannosyltransferase OCH1-like enzyme
MIPKIIHQTWKTKDIPENWKNAVESCKAMHADYAHMLWTDDTMERFMQTEYPDSLDLYKSYKYNI